MRKKKLKIAHKMMLENKKIMNAMGGVEGPVKWELDEWQLNSVVFRCRRLLLVSFSLIDSFLVMVLQAQAVVHESTPAMSVAPY